MSFDPKGLLVETGRRVRAGDIPGVVALLDAEITFTESVTDRAYGVWPVWRCWKRNLIRGVVACSDSVPLAFIDDVFRALMRYRSPHGDMFGFVKEWIGASWYMSGLYLLTWAEKIMEVDQWDLSVMQRVARSWMGETARWSPNRAAWAAAVVCGGDQDKKK